MYALSKKMTRKSPRSCLPAVLMLAGCSTAFAQTFAVPDAGQLSREQQQPVPARTAPGPDLPSLPERPAALAGGPSVVVRTLVLDGIATLPLGLQDELRLLAAAAAAAGQLFDMADFDGLAKRVGGRLHEAGYLLAQAWLPQQEVKDGQVRMQVVLGRLGQVEVRNRAGLDDSALAPLSLLPSGEPLTRGNLEASLLALAELPGVEVRSTLRPGQTLGASDLLVDVVPDRRWQGAADADNYGNCYSGAARLGASLFWNNPANQGDQASLRLQTSGEHMQYARLGYQLPVGSRGTRVGVVYSEMRYGLGKELANLDVTGSARIGSLYIQHPLLRGRARNLSLQAQYDRKELEDEIGASQTRTRKSLDVGTLGLTAQLHDPLGGFNSGTVRYVHGHLSLDAEAAALDAASARSAGSYRSWGFDLSRLQPLASGLALYLGYSAQWAGKNLDSSEKMTLGGPYGVRAYPQGEVSGDQGWLGSAELRWRLAPAWQAQLFYDEGKVRINQAPWSSGNNERRLAAWGLGLGWQDAGWALRGTLAWRAGTDAVISEPDRSPRAWVQAARYF